jgi:hypothetical protein
VFLFDSGLFDHPSLDCHHPNHHHPHHSFLKRLKYTVTKKICMFFSCITIIHFGSCYWPMPCLRHSYGRVGQSAQSLLTILQVSSEMSTLRSSVRRKNKYILSTMLYNLEWFQTNTILLWNKLQVPCCLHAFFTGEQKTEIP